MRLIVEGFPAVRGRTMLDKAEWIRRHADGLRRMLMLEPRGNSGMMGAVLTEPVAPGSHAGLVFMNGVGYPALSGHAVIAVVTIALERGLLMPGAGDRTIVFDTPAGTVRAVVDGGAPRVGPVILTNVPSCVV